jgi:hypothetical protein
MEKVEQKIKDALIKADVSGAWSSFLNMMDDNVTFSVTIPEGTPISGVFKGKTKVVKYFDTILPSVASFFQNKPMEFVIARNKVIVLGDDTYTIIKNKKSQRSPYAMIIDLKDGKIINILIIQDLSGIYQAYTSDWVS